MKKEWLLGKTADGERVCLEDFSWDCKWYWGGGYIHIYERGARRWHTHTHFDTYFAGKQDLFTEFNAMIKHSVLNQKQIWRLCDLMVQFYAFRKAAGCFQYGGHYTSDGRTEAEFRLDLAEATNKHIETVIIKEIRSLLDSTSGKITTRKARV